ncbi:glycerophosphodiester phosphodiesterase [Microbacterium sp. NPDC058345]|uniref:glycerophosphodiester phosphodiesterase n=1 Tax=Microbacterium sp. NPDC058345 TaxID=3346455 RepID=UPI00364EC17A
MAHAPENSEESFRRAEEAMVSEIELDVRCTSDDVLIVLHDDTLDRVAADPRDRGLGPVALLSFDDVRAVILNSGRPVLTLAEAFAATTVRLQVEIKERRAVPALAEFMRAHPGHADRTIFTTFDATALEEVSRLAPGIPRGIIVSDYPDGAEARHAIDALLARAGCDIFHCGWQGLTAEVVDRFHEAGLGVRGWPVRNQDDMRRALALGVDGITSDDPEQAWSWYREEVELVQ